MSAKRSCGREVRGRQERREERRPDWQEPHPEKIEEAKALYAQTHKALHTSEKNTALGRMY